MEATSEESITGGSRKGTLMLILSFRIGLMKSSSSISMKFSMALSVAIFLFIVLGRNCDSDLTYCFKSSVEMEGRERICR